MIFMCGTFGCVHVYWKLMYTLNILLLGCFFPTSFSEWLTLVLISTDRYMNAQLNNLTLLSMKLKYKCYCFFKMLKKIWGCTRIDNINFSIEKYRMVWKKIYQVTLMHMCLFMPGHPQMWENFIFITTMLKPMLFSDFEYYS